MQPEKKNDREALAEKLAGSDTISEMERRFRDVYGDGFSVSGIKESDVKNLTDNYALGYIALNHPVIEAKWDAVDKIDDAAVINAIVIRSADYGIRSHIMSKVEDTGVIEYIAQYDSEDWLRYRAACRSDEETALGLLEKEPETFAKIELLSKLSRHDPDWMSDLSEKALVQVLKCLSKSNLSGGNSYYLRPSVINAVINAYRSGRHNTLIRSVSAEVSACVFHEDDDHARYEDWFFHYDREYTEHDLGYYLSGEFSYNAKDTKSSTGL